MVVVVALVLVVVALATETLRKFIHQVTPMVAGARTQWLSASETHTSRESGRISDTSLLQRRLCD